MNAQTLRCVCPYDCPDTCGLLVEVENGRAVRVTGDPDHPVTRGMLCPKMNHYEKTVHSPRRLTTPLLRTGAKGSGEFALKVSEQVPAGTVVTEGVWWREFIPGERGVNALTSQRLTDGGRGS